jgi:hypothetical protein
MDPLRNSKPKLRWEMTNKYFISTKPGIDGRHSVHRHGCPFLPEPERRIILGIFQSPPEALTEAARYYPDPICCPFCSKVHNELKRDTFPVAGSAGDLISTTRLKSGAMDPFFCSVS